MRDWDRREFLSSLSIALIPVAAGPRTAKGSEKSTCWLEVCAPLIVEDPARGIHSDIILTSDTFAGARGHDEKASATDYEILMYDSAGRAAATKRLTVPALRTTVIPVSDLIGKGSFWGGARIRLQPQCGMHASDLFSSAFVRWRTRESFDNVHANPDPLQWQNTGSYYYSMPFPALSDYDCTFSLFNPYDAVSRGEIVMTGKGGGRMAARSYELKPRSSLLFHLNSASLIDDPWAKSVKASEAPEGENGAGGLLAVTNEDGTVKSFGYLMIRRGGRFSVEHPIHQGIFTPKKAAPPFDEAGKFKARNVLYTPLLFRAHRVGGVTLDTRVHLGSGLPLEESLWLYPFAVNGEGEAIWSTQKEERGVASRRMERGAIRLGEGESCALDFAASSIGRGFAGGLGVAVAPDATHTLMKVEVRVPEWGAHAFTHFRPGLRSARLYQKPSVRGGLSTDYIAAGARIITDGKRSEADEVIGVINIDDQGVEGRPVLEMFGPEGLIGRHALGAVPPFACRHYLLSELVKGPARHEQLTLRLTDERATLLMSIIHLDYERRDLALDHGSDRFSTFLDYGCQ